MKWKVRAPWIVAALLAACGGQSIRRTGDGESPGDAGESSGGTGGTSVFGGTGGTGGPGGTAFGGTAGTGLGGTGFGGAGTGGFSGTAGTGALGGTASGGSATGGASGGVAGTSGSAGVGTCSIGTAPRITFDTDTSGWSVKHTRVGLRPDGGMSPPLGPLATKLDWTGTDGMPATGALDVLIDFTAPGQIVGVGVNPSAPIDLSRTVVTVCVKLARERGPVSRQLWAGARIYAKSGPAYCYAGGDYYFVRDVGQWMLLRYDFARSPAFTDYSCNVPFEPYDVRELGVEFDTDGASELAPPAMFRIDTLSF